MEQSRTFVLKHPFCALTMLEFSFEPKLIYIATEHGSENRCFALAKIVNKFLAPSKVQGVACTPVKYWAAGCSADGKSRWE